MATVRALVTHWAAGDLPADYASHTVHHTIGGPPEFGPVDYQNHADEIKALFSGQDATHTLFTAYSTRHIDVKVYDLADPKPRPVKGHSTYVPSSASGPIDFGPDQVAVVLSFYGDRNLPHMRGRLYIGPHRPTETNVNRPATSLLNQLLDLGHGLFDIGGQNVAHVVHSRTENADHVIHNYWVDDRWDTMQKRLPKATKRLTLAP